MRIVLVMVAVAFIFGSLLGHATTTPRVDVVKVPHTVVKTETKVVTKTKPVSAVCVRALDLGDQIFRAAASFDASGTKQLDIITDARVALLDNDTIALGRVLERQNSLQGDTVGYVKNLSEVITEYRSARAQCKESQ